MAIYNPQTTYSPQQTGSTLQNTSGLTIQPAISASLLQPTTAPTTDTAFPTPYDSSGGGTGTDTSGGGSTYTDPYAAWGGQGAFDNLVSGFNTQDQNIHSTASDTAQNAALGRHSSILDFLDSLRRGQNSINERGVQNELAKKQGRNSIIDMLGRGLRSGGTLLANKNALSSSAAEAIARAYGDIGQRELNQVGNQYELENRNIGLAQEDFGAQKNTGLRKFGESEQQSIGAIVTDARDKLAALDAAMASADMPTRIAIEQEKQAIQDQITPIIGQFDTELNQGAAGVNPTSTEDRRATAFGLANAGVSATNPFDFSTEIPTQFQNTGPFSGELPIFSTLRAKKQVA